MLTMKTTSKAASPTRCDYRMPSPGITISISSRLYWTKRPSSIARLSSTNSSSRAHVRARRLRSSSTRRLGVVHFIITKLSTYIMDRLLLSIGCSSSENEMLAKRRRVSMCSRTTHIKMTRRTLDETLKITDFNK